MSSALHHPLDEILGTRSLVRVLRVLAVHRGTLGVADIAQRAALTLPSVRAALHQLMQLEVVSTVAAGRTMVARLRGDHPLVSTLLALFAAERDQSAAVLEAVREAARRLRPPPAAVWLYGSVARTSDDATSDIDIALVTTAPAPMTQADGIRQAVSRINAATADRLSIITMTPADIRRAARQRTGFWKNLERDAVVLFGDAPTGIVSRAGRARAS